MSTIAQPDPFDDQRQEDLPLEIAAGLEGVLAALEQFRATTEKLEQLLRCAEASLRPMQERPDEQCP